MSTGADCFFVEKEPGKWWYSIQCYPYGETDEYESHGPFKSLEKAEAHLYDHYANPGSYSIEPYYEEK